MLHKTYKIEELTRFSSSTKREIAMLAFPKQGPFMAFVAAIQPDYSS